MPLKVQPKETLVPLLVLRNRLFCRLLHYPLYCCQISQKTILKLKRMKVHFCTCLYNCENNKSYVLCLSTKLSYTESYSVEKTENCKENCKGNVVRPYTSYDNISGERFV